MFYFLPIFIRVSTVSKFLKVPLSKRRFPKITTGFGPGTFLNNLKFFSNFSYRIHLMNKIKMKTKKVLHSCGRHRSYKYPWPALASMSRHKP